MIGRLTDDHANALRLAKGIAEIPRLSIDLSRVKTNIIYFDVSDEAMAVHEIMSRLDVMGIKALPTSPQRFRMVTHYGIEAADIDRVITVLKEIMTGG